MREHRNENIDPFEATSAQRVLLDKVSEGLGGDNSPAGTRVLSLAHSVPKSPFVVRKISHWALAILIGLGILATPIVPANAAAPPVFGIGVSVSFGPPPLPYYAQPICPGPGYIWTPGYWAWDPAYGYYWVPGTWVSAPFFGALWTPGYWGWDADGDDFVWYPGYWGTVVGFYGGIDYGYGYTGYGYQGGYWQGRNFHYNREVNNVNVTNVTNVYNRTVVSSGNRVSFNGGNGGIQARPTSEQMAAARDRRMGAVAAQVRQSDRARSMPQERASVNRGRPEVAATQRAGDFNRGIVRASRAGGRYTEPPARRGENRAAPTRRGATQEQWHQFGRAPERPTAAPRTERPAGDRRTQPQPPEYRQQRAEYHRNAPQQMRENRQIQRQEAPQPRYQRETAPQQRNVERGHEDNGRGRDRGTPPGRRH